MMRSSVSAIIIVIFAVRQCAAVCCKNHNWLCIINSIDCTPNCSDGNSRCDLKSQVCKDDSIGGCIDIITKTRVITNFDVSMTSTSYTSTVYSIVTTSTYTATELSNSVYLLTSSAFATSIESKTMTELGTTITTTVVPNRMMLLLKRATTPTVTITSTSKDDNYCAKSKDPNCTRTVLANAIFSVTASTTVTSTKVNVVTSTIFVTSTIQTTKVQTIKGAEVVVTFTQAAKTTPPTVATANPSTLPATTSPGTISTTTPAAPTRGASTSSISSAVPTGTSPPSKAVSSIRDGLCNSYPLLVLALGISIYFSSNAIVF